MQDEKRNQKNNNKHVLVICSIIKIILSVLFNKHFFKIFLVSFQFVTKSLQKQSCH